MLGAQPVQECLVARQQAHRRQPMARHLRLERGPAPPQREQHPDPGHRPPPHGAGQRFMQGIDPQQSSIEVNGQWRGVCGRHRQHLRKKALLFLEKKKQKNFTHGFAAYQTKPQNG
jgi:hypothetical protein